MSDISKIWRYESTKVRSKGRTPLFLPTFLQFSGQIWQNNRLNPPGLGATFWEILNPPLLGATKIDQQAQR